MSALPEYECPVMLLVQGRRARSKQYLLQRRLRTRRYVCGRAWRGSAFSSPRLERHGHLQPEKNEAPHSPIGWTAHSIGERSRDQACIAFEVKVG
jgi:hypothetical protein